jgi:crotonobetainyl-CoA:carnitine CoA-transferase CaiB-like acyl-CoA transferase
MLADLGAEVIKVERPGAGDDTRAWGPPFLKDKNGENSKESGYYLGVNRGKKSITVDISKPRGQDIIKALAKDADIILENYKVGTLGRYQLDYDSIRKINEKIIYCSITGFGQTGPKSNQLAYDFLIQAMGGLMSVTGEKDQNPGGGPQKVGIPIIDLITGSYATIGILAALASREVTGQGEYIDMSMLDVQVGLLSNQAMNYLMTGKTPLRNGNAHPNIQPQDVFKCSDGQIVLAVGNDSQFEKLCEALELTELCKDQRFKTNAQRIKNLLELRSLLDQAFIKNSRSYWTQKMQDAEVPCGPINSIAEALNDPQIVHRQMVRELDHPISGKVPQVMTPFHFTNSSIKVDQAPPLLGQHTLSILSDLGLSDDEIQKLKDDCVI